VDCIFCKFATKEIPVNFVYESEKVFAINDIAPQAPIHVLIIPKAHLEYVSLVGQKSPEVLSEMIAVADQIAKERGLDGYRSVYNTGESAGQSVFHAHLHLLGQRSFAWPPG